MRPFITVNQALGIQSAQFMTQDPASAAAIWQTRAMATQQFPRDEIMAAYEAIVAAGDAGDWNRWADLHTVDCIWNEHNYGIIEGRVYCEKITLVGAPSNYRYLVDPGTDDDGAKFEIHNCDGL